MFLFVVPRSGYFPGVYPDPLASHQAEFCPVRQSGCGMLVKVMQINSASAVGGTATIKQRQEIKQNQPKAQRVCALSGTSGQPNGEFQPSI